MSGVKVDSSGEREVNLFELFQSPEPAYYPKLIWVWNQALSLPQRLQTIAEFHRHGFSGIVAVPGPGFPDQFDASAQAGLVTECRQEAARLELWLEYLVPQNSQDRVAGLGEAWIRILDRTGGHEIPACRERIRDGLEKLMSCDWSYNPVEAKRVYEMHLVKEGAPFGLPAIVMDSIEGTRKEIRLAVLGPCQPWWSFQPRLSQRLARLAAVLSLGEQSHFAETAEPSSAVPTGQCERDGAHKLLFHERKLDEGRLICTANPSIQNVRRWRLKLKHGETVYLGDLDTGQWSKPVVLPYRIPTHPRQDKQELNACETIDESEACHLDFDLTPGAVAVVWVSGTAPMVLSETRSRRGAKVIASLDFPDRFQIQLDQPAYLPLREWTLSAGMNRESPVTSTFRTEFQVCDCPQRMHLLVDGWGGWPESSCPPTGSEVRLNGELLSAFSASSWIDPFFRSADITSYIQPGRNVLEWTQLNGVDPIQSHHFHPWFLAGDFALRKFGNRWVIVEPCTEIGLGTWADWGYPFNPGLIRYRCRLDVPDTFRQRRVQMELSGLAGSAEIRVDGVSQGTILWQPWVLDVPALQHPGPHLVEIAVCSTLANLLYAQPYSTGLLKSVQVIAQ